MNESECNLGLLGLFQMMRIGWPICQDKRIWMAKGGSPVDDCTTLELLCMIVLSRGMQSVVPIGASWPALCVDSLGY